ncbi:MAG: winged helix-turn-helix transcriptional regulator [Candidatus Lokiarchaeota archaeon]|nr:winged helix-turn-helix transcriptional regulator [Candidatus Lokiarchaeota archaeon]
MSDHDPDDIIRVDDDVDPGDTGDYGFPPTPLQESVMKIAKELMSKHYILDSRKLYYACAREITEADNIDVMKSIDYLIKRRVLFPGKATSRDGVLKNDLRKRILDIVRAEPGIYFSKIRDAVNLDSNTLIWHLKMLEKFDFIRVEKFGNSTVFFDKFLDKALDVFYYYIHKDDSVDIFKQIATNPGLSFQDLLHVLNLPRTTLVRKLKSLIENGLLSVAYTSNRITSISIAPAFKEACLKFLYNLYWQGKPPS